jgi:hypothetical protein
MKEAQMYFHPLAREAASQHYVKYVPKEPAGYRSGNVAGGFEVQMGQLRELCIVLLKVDLTLSDGTRSTRFAVDLFSFLSPNAPKRVAIAARAGELVDEAEIGRDRVAPIQARVGAGPIGSHVASEKDSEPVKSREAKPSRAQRWLVDPRVG